MDEHESRLGVADATMSVELGPPPRIATGATIIGPMQSGNAQPHITLSFHTDAIRIVGYDVAAEVQEEKTTVFTGHTQPRHGAVRIEVASVLLGIDTLISVRNALDAQVKQLREDGNFSLTLTNETASDAS